MNPRYQQLLAWLATQLPAPPDEVAPASSDASFRRYFRVRYNGHSRIVMDAPPDKEDCQPFIAVAGALRALGLQAPEVLATDLDQGFLLLTDLGSRQYLAVLDETSVETLYGDALAALVNQPTSTPTLRWIFQMLEGINRVVTISIEGVSKVMIEGLTDLKIKILKLFGPRVCQLYQVDFFENQAVE